MTLKSKLIVGLADEAIGSQVADALQHVTGGTDALTVGATKVSLGVSGGSLGFFGAAVTARPAAVTVNATGIAGALINLGLIAGTTTA
jgi:hypothetical protein